MIQRSFSTEGIILSRKNYGEADRMLNVFTRHYGKIFLTAKGVRKLKSRKRGHIEIFSRLKFSYSKKDDFIIMTEAELIDSYEKIRLNLKKTALAYYFIEVISKIIRENEKHEDLYEILLKFLDDLKNTGKLKNLRYKFIEEILISLGYWPQGKELPDPDSVLERVLERQINSKRVGEKIFQSY